MTLLDDYECDWCGVQFSLPADRADQIQEKPDHVEWKTGNNIDDYDLCKNCAAALQDLIDRQAQKGPKGKKKK